MNTSTFFNAALPVGLLDSRQRYSGYAVYKARMLYALLGYRVEDPDLELCAAASRGGSSVADILNSLTPAEEQHEENSFVTVYPNPNNGQFHVESSLDKGATLEVLDVTGRVVQKFVLDSGDNDIDCGSNAPGLYLYRIMKNNHNLQTGKLTILK